jgi:hypothetical protein
MQQKHRLVISVTVAALAGVLLVSTTPAFAQWENVKSPNLPRTADGKPNLSAPVPRGPDGKPNLSGIWWLSSERAAFGAPPKYLNNIAADLKPEEVPFQPWAAALYKQRGADFSKDVPYSRCLPPGVPMISSFTAPWKLIQNPGLIAILYENSTTYRQIFTDGRVLSKDANPTWMGYSTGHWEGDTLVVETAGFNDKTWMDFSGHPHTEALRVTERFHRRDVGHMDIQFTFDDPKAYTKPWTVTIHPILLVDGDLFEFVCNENEKDLQHFVGK